MQRTTTLLVSNFDCHVTIYTWAQALAVNKIPSHRTEMDLRATDHAGYLTAVSEPTVQTLGAAGGTTAPLPNSSWIPLTISSWLGSAEGQFMRFPDTNLMPDIEIRIRFAAQQHCAVGRAERQKLCCSAFVLGHCTSCAPVEAPRCPE